MKKRLITCIITLFFLFWHNTMETNANVLATQANQTHPYLYFTLADVPGLRQAASTTHKPYFDYLKTWADKFIGFNPLPLDSLPTNIDIMQVYCENSASYIVNMSLIYHLTGDTTYLRAAKKWLLAFGSYPADINGNYCIGAYAVAVASGYDMLYNELTTAEQTQLSQHLAAIVQRGMQGTSTDWWAGISLNHDHWLPITGLGVGAAALYYEAAEAPNWLTFFLNILNEDMNIVGDDGAWTEGTADWIYAMALTYVFFDVYKRVSGNDMFQSSMAKNAIDYRIYNWLPDNTYIYHHDSFANGRYNVMGSASCHLMHKLAHEHQDGHAQWLAGQEEILDLSYVTQNKTINSDWHISKNSLVRPCTAWAGISSGTMPRSRPRRPTICPDTVIFPTRNWSSCAPAGRRRTLFLPLPVRRWEGIMPGRLCWAATPKCWGTMGIPMPWPTVLMSMSTATIWRSLHVTASWRAIFIIR